MSFNFQISIGDIILSLTVIVALIGLYLNFSQMKKGNSERRFQYLMDLYKFYSEDQDVREIYYKIEYGEFKYIPEEFHGSDEEKKVDKLLEFFDNIGKLYISKNITDLDISYFAYEFLIVYQDKEIKKYLSFFDDWHEYRNVDVLIKPYTNFTKVGDILEKRFYKPR